MKDWAYAAFAMRIRIAILLARADYDGIATQAARAIRNAEVSGDDYAVVQILNVLGAAHFDCATSKLPEPHARAHLTSLDPPDTLPMTGEASKALEYFEKARRVAERADYAFAAWYVSGNIERLQILLGNAGPRDPRDPPALARPSAAGARYDEIVTRSNLAWGLRTLGLHQEALHELDVALGLARETGTFNVLLEFLEYDRSIVLGALGDTAGSRASYGATCASPRADRASRCSQSGATAPGHAEAPPRTALSEVRRPLHPGSSGEPLEISALASQCGVSMRTLEKGFSDYRGLTPVAHIRNLRLDHARHAMPTAKRSSARSRRATVSQHDDVRDRIPQALRRLAQSRTRRRGDAVG